MEGVKTTLFSQMVRRGADHLTNATIFPKRAA
jgi:hypothetical protein